MRRIRTPLAVALGALAVGAMYAFDGDHYPIGFEDWQCGPHKLTGSVRHTAFGGYVREGMFVRTAYGMDHNGHRYWEWPNGDATATFVRVGQRDGRVLSPVGSEACRALRLRVAQSPVELTPSNTGGIVVAGIAATLGFSLGSR